MREWRGVPPQGFVLGLEGNTALAWFYSYLLCFRTGKTVLRIVYGQITELRYTFVKIDKTVITFELNVMEE